MQNHYVSKASKGAKRVDYETFYVLQAGNGLDAYVSYPHLRQRGNGFFGRLLKGTLLPLMRSVLPYLRDRAVEGVAGVVKDVVNDGISIKEAGKRQLRSSAAKIMEDAAEKIKNQSGKGIKRKTRKSIKEGIKRKKVAGKRKAIRKKKKIVRPVVLFP